MDFNQLDRLAKLGLASVDVDHCRSKTRMAAAELDNTRVDTLIPQGCSKLASPRMATCANDASSGVEHGKQVHDGLR